MFFLCILRVNLRAHRFFAARFDLTTERIIFWTYVAVGPFAWIVFAYLMSVGRERMTKLRQGKYKLPASPPLVSILIPAKDEGSHIRTCIERVLQQDYPAFEVIAINDRSSDDTGAILDELVRSHADSCEAGSDPARVGVKTLRAVHIADLPSGWLGKCHALDEGAKHAKGEWLFFVDSDVKLDPEALSRIAALAIDRKCDAVSITTTIQTEHFIEKLMLPLLAATWITMFMADQTNEDSEPDKALANGQVFLIRADIYNQVGGHAAVKDRIVEDVELMRLMKKSGLKTRFYAGRHLASTRMHTHFKQMLHGWARIFAGTSRGKIWPMLLAMPFFVVCVLSVYPILIGSIIFGATYWLVASLIHFIVMTICMGLMWVWSGNNPIYALLLPISVPIELWILGFSIRRAISGTIDWRGAQLSLRETTS